MNKIPLVATGREGEVYLDEVVVHPSESSTGTGATITDRGTREQLTAIHSQLASVKDSITSLVRAVETNDIRSTRLYNSINNNVKRIAINPRNSLQRQTQPVSELLSGTQQNVTLSRSPKTLFELWDEWTHGLNGRKAAKDFTHVERGQVKHKFSRRKVVWDCVIKLINSGLTAQVSIDRSYEAYGRHNNVTTIINRMRKDRKEGYTPSQIRVG